MCIPPIIARASVKAEATFLMRRIPKPCNLRLTVCEGGCVANDEEELLQILTFLLMTIGMAITDPGQGLLLVSLSRVMMTTIISAKIGGHLAKT